MKNNVVLIFSGYNNRGVIAFCRFCINQNISFFIVSSGSKDPIYLTDYKHKVIYKREENKFIIEQFRLYKEIISQKISFESIVILPSTEFLNRFLLKNKFLMENQGFTVPICRKDLYEQISDKYSFGKLCMNYDIKIPKEYNFPKKSHIPFVAKPKTYFTDKEKVNSKPILILDEKDYVKLKQRNDLDHFFYQDFVEGKSIYLLYYFKKDGGYKVFSQENLIQQDQGRSIIAARSTDYHEQLKVVENFTKLFLDFKYIGLLMIELKVGKERSFMIEANPRIWGPSQLILDSNMGLFHAFAYDFDLIQNQRDEKMLEYKKDIFYFWSGGLKQDLYNNKSIVFHNYSKDMFLGNYHNLHSNDIYSKSDTFQLFIHEQLSY